MYLTPNEKHVGQPKKDSFINEGSNKVIGGVYYEY